MRDTARELVDELKNFGPQTLAVVFLYMRDRVDNMALRDGRHLKDYGDFKEFLGELAEEAKKAGARQKVNV